MTKEQFLTCAGLITEKYGCKIAFLDLETQNIELNCPDDASKTKCALEFAEVLGSYLHEVY